MARIGSERLIEAELSDGGGSGRTDFGAGYPGSELVRRGLFKMKAERMYALEAIFVWA
ncbi:hypothetical protein PISMIDRAFT_689388 [Pisolithus microcarpus 441]|uniref:Uncharacterized protein n=1 Tax=Pisolithus microcarpus 441 TaxID=765257 RepID=A0A0C9YXB3_9AGAM|nr:hypothetical protein PISMIDRAFT_689388 [Pisolithus microcarpus 441]